MRLSRVMSEGTHIYNDLVCTHTSLSSVFGGLTCLFDRGVATLVS